MDEGTFSDDRLRTLIRRMDRGEITRGEFCNVMVEHQVDFARFHRIGAEVDAERWWIAEMVEMVGWPASIAMGACWASMLMLAAVVLARAITPGP